MVKIFTTDEEKSALYEGIGRAVAANSKLEHVAIELALVWDTGRATYGNSLGKAFKYASDRLAGDPERLAQVEAALKDTEELTDTRNAIVHGVWMEVHLDDEGRFFAVRTMPEYQTRKQENPEHMVGKAMSTRQIQEFANTCEAKMRQLGAVRDSLHAEMRWRAAKESSSTGGLGAYHLS